MPVPIPKFDPDGQRLGLWGADDVMQIDPYAKGRGGSVPGERYAETEVAKLPPGWPVVGNEHLSQLREGYLRLLADELSFSYMRLESPAAGARELSRRMQQRPLARVAPTPVSVRPLFGLIGLLALLWVYLAALLHRLSAWTGQRLRATWFGRSQPSGTGTPR